MPILHLLLLAGIQGLTEFLPVSSSAHLILLPNLTGLADQGLALDVAVHVGTLAAVIVYFRRDVGAALSGLGALAAGRVSAPEARLALNLAVATVPVVLAGLAVKLAGLDQALRSIAVIGWATLVFALLLYWADRTGAEAREARDWTLRDALVMGLWQAAALIPGTSRSGITITAARRLGYRRADAARLSMLMSIPTIAASGVLLGAEVAASDTPGRLADMAVGAAFAFVMALAALALMMRLLRSVSFTPYVVYRILLGGMLLWLAYG